MSTKAQVKMQAKTPAAPAAARIPPPTAAVPEHEAERPDIASQLKGAARLGHSLGAVGVEGYAPHKIQRQVAPEEEEKELQMKWEPAAIQRQEIPEEEEEELQMKQEPAAVQRQELPEEEEELMLMCDEQRVGPQGGQVHPEVEAAIRRARGGGQPLEGALQEQMSGSLGHDFSGVRVHSGPEADELSQQLQAKAFTTGPDIFFRRGEYNPSSSGSRGLIAHELSHVVQQSGGRARGDGTGIMVRPAGDAFEYEADRVAAALTRSINTSVHRKKQAEEDPPGDTSEEELQTPLGERHPGTGSEDNVTRINSASGSGPPLPTDGRGRRVPPRGDIREVSNPGATEAAAHLKTPSAILPPTRPARFSDAREGAPRALAFEWPERCRAVSAQGPNTTGDVRGAGQGGVVQRMSIAGRHAFAVEAKMGTCHNYAAIFNVLRDAPEEISDAGVRRQKQRLGNAVTNANIGSLAALGEEAKGPGAIPAIEDGDVVLIFRSGAYSHALAGVGGNRVRGTNTPAALAAYLRDHENQDHGVLEQEALWQEDGGNVTRVVVVGAEAVSTWLPGQVVLTRGEKFAGFLGFGKGKPTEW